MLEVKVFLDEEDKHDGKPLYEYIVRYLMHHQILGATVFNAHAGYGHKHHLHHPKGLGTVDENPLMIMFIDDDVKINSVLPHVKEVVKEGLIIINNVEKY